MNIKDTLTFQLPLPKTVKAGEEVKVYVTAKDDGGTGFRAYLTGGVDSALSDIQAVSGTGSVSKDIEFTLTATGDASHILFKGPNYNTNMADITFEYIAVE